MWVRAGLLSVLLMQIMVVAGCGGPAPRKFAEEKRVLTPVTGVVKIDGKAIEKVEVSLAPLKDKRDEMIPDEYSFESMGLTDADGKFEIYTSNPNGAKQGAPAGEYVAVFRKPGVTQKRFFRKKLAAADAAFIKKYTNSGVSKVPVKVEEGSAVDLGVIELKSK